MKTSYTAAAALLLIAGCAEARPPAASSLRSGLYEGLSLAVAPDGRVVGRFLMEQEGGGNRRCDFVVTGRLDARGATVRALATPYGAKQPPVGRIDPTGDGVRLTLPGSGNLSGCAQVAGPFLDDPKGLELSRTGAGGWTGLARVRAVKVPLRAQPGGAAGRAYVVQGDVVGIAARSGANVRVIYPSDRQVRSEGWVPAAALEPVAR
ncbi:MULTISPECIES: hypothetical protein [unclassified Sphingomonas]|uniref:hypothetical protein n=1 Tax=unclassified Sphingomonas TaxID=196159 RepID=UPI0006F3F507|nr:MULTISPECIES: hypothetical protein [unclassified Sphingomonas]KQM61350.1 hypothetical protein ASE65_07350 [Sphingomonas sp. Leaf16]KQN12445.1 hypothetical protein ASE81_08360 [Sphingomonas sp. Leaf29]KQN18926.1 hypothetical protein ASE83_08285 [Sphingomonas sp. Leaf32]